MAGAMEDFELRIADAYPVAVLGAPRGRTSPPRPVALPEGWLADRDDPRPPSGAELEVSGG